MHVIETEQNNNRELHQHSSSTIIAIGSIQKCARSLGGGEKKKFLVASESPVAVAG